MVFQNPALLNFKIPPATRCSTVPLRRKVVNTVPPYNLLRSPAPPGSRISELQNGGYRTLGLI